MVSDDLALKWLGEQHFRVLFQDDDTTNLVDQLKVIRLFPTLIEVEDVDSFLEPITSQEVEVVLKEFKKDKALGQMDGLWNSFWPFSILLGMNWSW